MQTIFSTFKDYSASKFSKDFLAALTVAVLLIPQAMAYAKLAGLPPVYGLYGSIVPLVAYAIFASSRFLSIGPVALVSIILYDGLGNFAAYESSEYIQLVLLVGLLSGAIQLLFAALKLGVLSRFLSKPVLNGFISAAAIIIIVSQLKSLLGIEIEKATNLLANVKNILVNCGSINSYSAALGLGATGLLIAGKKLNDKLPLALIIVALATIFSYYAGMEAKGIEILGEISAGLPPFSIEFVQPSKMLELFPLALIISLICFVGSFSIMNAAENENRINANQELLALGLSKLAGSFFGAMPSTGSFSRSVINEHSGAVTQISSILLAGLILLFSLFFSSLLYHLPTTILAAIIIASVYKLVRLTYGKMLFRTDRRDFYVFLATFLATLLLGIVNGILVGIVLSLLSIIQRLAKPHYAVLGKLPKSDSFRNIQRYPEAIQISGTLILRYDQDLFFGNCDHFYEAIVKKIEHQQIDHLILHIGSVQNIDSTAKTKLDQLFYYCKMHSIRLIFTNVCGPIRDLFHRTGFVKMLGKENFHLNVKEAVHSIGTYEELRAKRYADQTNLGDL